VFARCGCLGREVLEVAPRFLRQPAARLSLGMEKKQGYHKSLFPIGDHLLLIGRPLEA
jgi:hypothetical protein